MKQLTPETIKALYATMTQYYDTELIEHWNGGAETSMAVLSLYLNQIGIKHVPAFMQSSDFTMGGEIYVPYAPGADPNPIELLIDAMHCASAHQRVLHWRECDRPYECELLYLLAPVSRVNTELDALQAAMEVYQWGSSVLGSVPQWVAPTDLDGLLADIAVYGSDLTLELANAKQRLTDMIAHVAMGAVSCAAARDVLAFFEWDKVSVR